MSRLGRIACGLLGLLILPVSAHAASFWFSASPVSTTVPPVTVADGTVSVSVDVYLDSDTPFFGPFISYAELNVQAGGNATLYSVDPNPAYFPFETTTGGTSGSNSPFNSPTQGEIADFFGLANGPLFGPVTDVLLGTFTMYMPAGGTSTTVTLDADPLAGSVIFATGDPQSATAVTVASGQVVFDPAAGSPVPLPSAAWAGMGLLAILALTRKTRQLVLA